jgi:two-component system, NarL family, sensor histidine kinase DesK
MVNESAATSGDSLVVGPHRWAQGRRRIGLATGMLVYPLVTAVQIPQHTSGSATIAGYAIVAAFCACYVLAGVLVTRAGRVTNWLLLATMTALFVAELPFAQVDTFFLCAVLVSLPVNLARRYSGFIVAGAVLASLVVPVAVRPWHSGPGLLQAVAIVFTFLVVYAFSEMVNANRELVRARAEVVRLASEAERSRIARDLHDLLGHSLTAITVKSGLARRLAATGSDRTVEEITEVEQLSRQALADVRAAVSGFREVTLAGELARGRELLWAAGITADLPSTTEVVDRAHQELFGWVVREGLTNVVRHARASRCTVTVSAAAVEVRDDGIGGPPSWGNGLSGLRERVTAAGGVVVAEPLGPKGWRLSVSLGQLPPRLTPASARETA